MYLGEFEQIVLIAVLRLGENAYAIPIREEIEQRTGRKIARGALYTALDRLEAKRCLRSNMSEPLPERGGRFVYPGEPSRPFPQCRRSGRKDDDPAVRLDHPGGRHRGPGQLGERRRRARHDGDGRVRPDLDRAAPAGVLPADARPAAQESGWPQ